MNLEPTSVAPEERNVCSPVLVSGCFVIWLLVRRFFVYEVVYIRPFELQLRRSAMFVVPCVNKK